MTILFIILVVLALACFGLAMIGANSKINLVAAGLFTLTLAYLLNRAGMI